jgi:hypothetical protein
MNTIHLEPADVLFFRDGRPMTGASSGQGAAWPLPSVVNHAFHAALHRAGEIFERTHTHRRGRSGSYTDQRDRKFGSLVTAGPFPVCTNGEADTWFFPRPADAIDVQAGEKTDKREVLVTHFPATALPGGSSLPAPSTFAAVNSQPPSKDTPKAWWSEGAWNSYLRTPPRDSLAARLFFKNDTDFSDTEHAYGIGISPETGSVEDGMFYSAHYLRMRPGWKLGVFAEAEDKEFEHPQHAKDLVRALLNGKGTEIIAGGQQRVCTATLQIPSGPLPLPTGLTTGFKEKNGRHLVKWVLLSPAVWPRIGDHAGGWLPSWVHQDDGAVLLLDGPGKNYAKRHKVPEGKPISARLVSAIIPKPLPVTGYALPHDVAERKEGGAKPTHLAVPAGAVYYFEADSPESAIALAAALNWHGTDQHRTKIVNRRSTLFGEKGFGLGVCGTWDSHPAHESA